MLVMSGTQGKRAVRMDWAPLPHIAVQDGFPSIFSELLCLL